MVIASARADMWRGSDKDSVLSAAAGYIVLNRESKKYLDLPATQ